MKLTDIYSYLIASWLNGGGFTRPGRMESTSIVPQYNIVFTKTSAKQIYRITGIKPTNYDIDFVDYLRDRMFELNPAVYLDITVFEHPVIMDVNGEKFQRSFHKTGDAYSSYKEAFDSQSGLARLTGKTYKLPGGQRLKLSRNRLDELYQVFVSHKYLYEHMSSGGTLCITNIFIEIVGENFRDVKRAGQDLYGLLGAMNIGCELVKSANRAYLMELGAATPAPKTLNKKFLPQLLFTEENVAAWSPYKARGLVGGGKGAILLGCDFRSRLPFSIDIFRSAAAQVFLLLGKTGSGKTYAAFQMALSALASGCYVSAIDIKGREWVALTAATDQVHRISFDDRHPSFVNTMRLDDMIITSENASELFNTSVKGTTQLFMLILNLQPGEGNPNDAELVIREAVMKLFSNHHVDPANPATFKNTRTLRYADVLPILEGLQSTASYTPEQVHMIRLARSRLNAYLGDSGIFADAFRNEISLGEVLTSKFVIYELNKNQGAMTDSLDVIRVFMIQYLDSKKKAMLKERGEFLFCFYEELQRASNFANLLSFVCSETTGARSNNAVVILLLNSLKVLQSKEGQDIRSNITSIICGLCEENDIVTLGEEFSRPWLAGQLKLMASKQQIYRNCFACDIDLGWGTPLETVYKVELPADLSKSFRTRTIREDE